MSFLIDRELDDSYCPSEVEVYAGTALFDLQYVCGFTIPSDVSGWVTIPLYESKVMEKRDIRGVIGFYFRLVITENFKSGKDTHIRQFLVLGPHSEGVAVAAAAKAITTTAATVNPTSTNIFDGVSSLR